MARCSKSKALSINNKLSIVRKVENGFNQANICRNDKISRSTVGTMWENGE